MNNIDFLHPEVRSACFELIDKCNKDGITIEIETTLRTKQEQNILYNTGRLSSGNVVTNKKYPNSYHCWGLGIDIKPIDDDKLSIVVKYAKDLGFTWGVEEIDSCNNDKYHFCKPILSISELKEKFNDYDEYRSTWNANYRKPNIITEDMIKSIEKHQVFVSLLQKACIIDNPSLNLSFSDSKIIDKFLEKLIDNFKYKQGKRYQVVKVVQKLLTKNKYSVAETGVYDMSTMTMIREFKRDNDMTIDGSITSELLIYLIARLP